MAESRFCTRCGRPLRPNQTFCTSCGSPVTQGASAHAPSIVAAPAAAQLSSAAAVSAQVASAAAGLPWQSVVGGKDFDLRAFLASGAMPVAQAAARASLRTPALALLATSLLDLAAALLSGEPAALTAVGLRVGMTVATAVLGLVAGKRAGGLRRATGVLSILTVLVQLGSVAMTSIAALGNPSTLLPLLPSVVSQLSSLAMSIKTAIVGLRS